MQRMIRIPNSNSRNRGSRRRGNNRRNGRAGRALPTLSLSLSDAFERQLAVRKDNFISKGKVLVVGATGTTLYSLQLSAQVFDPIYTNYMRWRLIKMIFKPVVLASNSSNNVVTVGISDDGIIESPTYQQVFEYRTSTVMSTQPTTGAGTFVAKDTDSAELVFEPVDKDVWFYTDIDQTGTDERFGAPGVLYIAAATSATLSLNYAIYYVIEFAGKRGT